MNFRTIEMLEMAKSNSEQVAREIYYAMSFLDYTHPARANLKVALSYLGAETPDIVGLSNSVLKVK
jgi:hypothetical protein